MNLSIDKTMFDSMLEAFDPVEHQSERLLALYSAAISLSDEIAMDKLIKLGVSRGLEREDFYEMVLQSYLFCGFPRMLEAAKLLDSIIPLNNSENLLNKISDSESEQWYKNGMDLCRRVYKDKYEPLKEKVMTSAPDVFRWMIVEGYGKVLSRDKVDVVTRELAIVAILMMENREKQLHSHILGAINVGCDRKLLETVIEDIGVSAGDGYKTAREILSKV